jgi:heme-degrading monooxygenase HmoA
VVEHIVLFKIKPEVDNQAVEHMFAGLRALKDSVPGIVDLSVGRNFTDRGKGYNCGLVVRLESKAALDVYRDHPDHQQVLQERIKPIVEDVLAVDYEF